MRVVGNIIWLVVAGIWLAIGYTIAAFFSVVLIVTIPFAVPSLRLAGYALWPFGRTVVYRPQRDVALSLLGNVVWFIFAGWWLALAHLVSGLLLMFTIIGIPFGVADFKMAGLALAPFGKQVIKTSELQDGDEVAAAIPEIGQTLSA